MIELFAPARQKVRVLLTSAVDVRQQRLNSDAPPKLARVLKSVKRRARCGRGAGTIAGGAGSTCDFFVDTRPSLVRRCLANTCANAIKPGNSKIASVGKERKTEEDSEDFHFQG